MSLGMSFISLNSPRHWRNIIDRSLLRNNDFWRQGLAVYCGLHYGSPVDFSYFYTFVALAVDHGRVLQWLSSNLVGGIDRCRTAPPLLRGTPCPSRPRGENSLQGRGREFEHVRSPEVSCLS